MNYERLQQTIASLKIKYQLTDFQFDTECIYNLGDLSTLLRNVVTTTLSEKPITVTEKLSEDGQQYIATLTYKTINLEVMADAFSDWLPDTFFIQLESIPHTFQTDKHYYSINPALGLTGQDAWYFCGSEQQLRQARVEGLPLVFPGEDPTDTDEFRQMLYDGCC